MIITAGEGLTLWSQIQASMRLRGLLKYLEDLKQGQGLLWVAPQPMQKLMKKGDFSLHALTIYALNQQAKRLQETLTARAFLGVQHVARQVVNDQLRLALNDPANQIRIHKRHRGAFIESVKRDTAKLYGGGVQGDDTETVLKTAYQASLKAAALTEDDLSPEQKEQITGLAQQTAQLIPELPNRPNPELSGEMTQHAENVGQQLQEGTQLIQSLVDARNDLRADQELDYAKNSLVAYPLVNYSKLCLHSRFP